MKYEEAKKVAEIVSEINKIEKQKEYFDNTKEFCKISFRGEDGAERQFNFSLDEKGVELIKEIRRLVEDKFTIRLMELKESLALL